MYLSKRARFPLKRQGSYIGGFLGIGGSSAKTDRGAQLSARQGLWDTFGFGLPQGKQQEAQGQTNLQAPASYFSQLLHPTRASTAQLAAPAVNAAQEQSDAANRQAAQQGTARGGGTAAANAERQTQTQKTIDDTINQNLVAGRQAGATGLAGIGKAELANAMSLLGLSTDAVNDIMSDAAGSRATSAQLNAQAQQQWGTVLGGLVSAIPV